MASVPLLPWAWLPSQQDSDSDPKAIAIAIDAESYLQFSRVAFKEWVRYSIGYPTTSVEQFLQQHTNLFIHLLTYLRGFPDEIEKYIKVEKVRLTKISVWVFKQANRLIQALRIRSPFAHRALAQCLLKLFPGDDYAISHSSKPAFRFIASPIQRLFKEYPTTLARILEVLCVLAIRFRQTYIHTRQMDWHSPFNVDISFINDIFNSSSPVDLAGTLTNSDLKAFGSLSPQNIVDEDRVARQYITRQHLLSRSVWECCLVLPDQTAFI